MFHFNLTKTNIGGNIMMLTLTGTTAYKTHTALTHSNMHEKTQTLSLSLSQATKLFSSSRND